MRSTAVSLVLSLAFLVSALASPAVAGGFDQFGYNYAARVFVGLADGVDRNIDGAVWGVPTYANDHLVMKWSKAWDDARFNGAPWTTDAWVNNEWNGNVPGGSSWMEIVKIVWIGGNCGDDGKMLPNGGYCIWGEFEAIMDQGVDPTHSHIWYAHATPTGYGSNP